MTLSITDIPSDLADLYPTHLARLQQYYADAAMLTGCHVTNSFIASRLDEREHVMGHQHELQVM